MEFKLNKIDTDVKERINNITKEGVVHNKTSPFINKDKYDKDSNSGDEKNKKGQIVIEAEMDNGIEVEASKDEDEESSFIGRFLDTRK